MSTPDERHDDNAHEATGGAFGDEPVGDPWGVGDADPWGQRVEEGTDSMPKPGDVVASEDEELASPYGYRVGMVPEPVVGPDVDSPLAEGETDGIVPANPLWAMKQHGRAWHLLPSRRRHDHLRERVAKGNETVYAIDDGRRYVTLGHQVGSVPRHGVGYCLVGRVTRRKFDEIRAGATAPADAFDQASELTLCGVVADDQILAGAVFDVERYDDSSAVPKQYLPGSPFLELDEDLEITVE